MGQFKTHIAFRLLACLSTIALLVPTTIKLIHTLEHHEHIVCNGEATTHIHQVDLDCEFHNFNLNNNFLPSQNDFDCIVEIDNFKKIISQYQFISDYQRLNFSLRGPPQINLA